MGNVRQHQVRRCRSDSSRFLPDLRFPVPVEAQVLGPGCLNVDLQWPLLHTTDILFSLAQFPGNSEAMLEEPRWDLCPENGLETWDQAAQLVQHRRHLSCVPESVAGDGTPDQRHRL